MLTFKSIGDHRPFDKAGDPAFDSEMTLNNTTTGKEHSFGPLALAATKDFLSHGRTSCFYLSIASKAATPYYLLLYNTSYLPKEMYQLG